MFIENLWVEERNPTYERMAQKITKIGNTSLKSTKNIPVSIASCQLLIC